MATPLKILFADDDLKYSLLLKRFLEKEGYDVAYTGKPTPSSVTVSSISLSFRITTTRILTSDPEYLIAFSIRLLRILAICTGSAVTNGRSGGKAVEKATCFPNGI